MYWCSYRAVREMRSQIENETCEKVKKQTLELKNPAGITDPPPFSNYYVHANGKCD